jgi:predicted phosphodiesterase
MKIAYASDLHLEFRDLYLDEIEPGDVLILAGDILSVKELMQQVQRADTDSSHVSTINFFDRITTAFKHVIMVMGNHEYYGSDINKGLDNLKKILDYSNLHILDGEYIEIENNLFICGTLWTDFNNEDPFTLMRAPLMINDFKIIYNNKERISPADILARHKNFVKWFTQVDKIGYDNVILVTHHSPSYQTIADHYKHDYEMNGLFGSNLDYLLGMFDYAFFGHQHDPKTPVVHDCRLLNNARGYPHEEMHDNFKLKYITI